MMTQTIDFAEVFARLTSDGRTEEAVQLGGVNVRTIRVKGGSEGHWDHHDQTTETGVVWNGDFSVEFRQYTLQLSSGQCCVVPVGAQHRGTSKDGAEVILFQQAQ